MHAAEHIDNNQTPHIAQHTLDAEVNRVETFLRRKTGLKVADILSAIKAVMWNNVGIIRDSEKLMLAQQEVKKLQDEAQSLSAEDKSQLQSCLEIQDMLKTAEVIILAALERKESRGAHYRSDYPHMDPAWEKNIRVSKDQAGKLVTKVTPPVRE
jgi:succinate dehydrogenase/fumarate reductase flavoprotein subunit